MLDFARLVSCTIEPSLVMIDAPQVQFLGVLKRGATKINSDRCDMLSLSLSLSSIFAMLVAHFSYNITWEQIQV